MSAGPRVEATSWTDLYQEAADGEAAVLVDDQVLVLSSLAAHLSVAVRDRPGATVADLAALLESAYGAPAAGDAYGATQQAVDDLVAAGVLRVLP